VVLPLPQGLKNEAQFALRPKEVNAVEMLGKQHHCQCDAVCDIVIEQTNNGLDDEIRVELMVHYGAVTYTSSTCACPCMCFGQITDRAPPVVFKNVDETF
jgi:hypothetical protein